MAVEFRCEKCGKILNVDAAPGGSVKCVHCGKKVVVPEALASMPRPHVPPNAAQGAPPSPPPGEAPAPEPAVQGLHEDSATMAVMSTIMPWVFSVFLHVALGLILAFVTLFVIEVEGREVTQADVVVTDTLDSTITPGEDSKRKKTLAKKEQRRYSKHRTHIQKDKGKTKKQIRLITRNTALGGSFQQHGLSGTGGLGPRSSFMGSGGNAYHIVYVVDRSGSMANTFDYVKQQIIRSITHLHKSQNFHVILFASGTPIENKPHRLVKATDAQKFAVADFIEMKQASGQTNPIPSLTRAFEVLKSSKRKRGKLIYLLTDGDFPDNSEVLKKIAGLNRDKSVHINTYLYGPIAPTAVTVLKQIAAENGGKFKYVNPED